MRYPLIEALVGFLFLGVYLVDVVSAPRAAWDQIPTSQLVVMSYHLIFVSLLVAATFIDYDLMIIPDEITVTGMIVGVGLGTVWPWVRPEPSDATTPWGGFWVGVFGLLIGAGVTDLVRRTGSAILRKEAMGFGDVTLQAMIGSFLGWQAAVVGFFLSSFFGLAHAVWKLLKYLEKWVLGRELSTSDRELPLGPYLSMAALTLLLGWRWLWPSVLREYFETFRMIFWWMLGVSVS
jgi:leader peptidase (prepilin peptidase)/N-methyltransferase